MSQQQAARSPTVGDTLTVVHRVAVPSGALIEPRGLLDSTVATLVGAPDVRREGDSVRIAYTIAVWAPGRHQLAIPGAVVVAGDGRIDTLPDATVALRVASVLPERVATESIAPQAARPWVERSERSPLPFAALLLPLALCLLAAAWWWRRRGPRAVEPGRSDVSRGQHSARLAEWLAAGEAALVVDHLTALLPDDVESRAWREQVRAIRFDPGGVAELATLAETGVALLQRRES